MASGEIGHKGVVVSVNPQYTTVEIIQESACASCHAAGLCTMSEVEKKAVQVPTNPYRTYSVGQQVNLVLRQSMGLKAVWLCYGVPLVLLLLFIFVFSETGFSELATGLLSIAGLGVWYFVIWLMRERLSNEYVFCIKEIQS